MQPTSDRLSSTPRAVAVQVGAPATPPELIVAPPSPPCSPRSMRAGLAGLHRAPDRRYPQPSCAIPSAIVPRSRFRLAHPKHPMPYKHVALPKKSVPSTEVAPDEWMILKLDEDLCEADDDGYLSDGAAELGDVHGRDSFELDSHRHGAFVGAASVPAPVPLSLPVRGAAPPVRLRRRFRVPLAHQYASAAASNAASRSYRNSSSFGSSDSGLDDDR